jgi:hypothetical protein
MVAAARERDTKSSAEKSLEDATTERERKLALLAPAKAKAFNPVFWARARASKAANDNGHAARAKKASER